VPIYRREWLRRTEAFFMRWGAFAVVAGRWVPFVRTGGPFLAGVTRMSYQAYVPYNILGAVSWVWSMVFIGYFMPPLVARIAPGFNLEEHIDPIVLIVVFLSLIPVLYTIWKERSQSRISAPLKSASGFKSAAKRRKK